MNQSIVLRRASMLWAVGAIVFVGFATTGLAQQSTFPIGGRGADSPTATLPKDVDPDSGFRLPLLRTGCTIWLVGLSQ
jgi:hypothetical protein